MQSLLAILVVLSLLGPDVAAAQKDSAVAPVPARTAQCTKDTAEAKNGAGAVPAAGAADSGCQPGTTGMAAPARMPGMPMSPEQLKQMQAPMGAMQGNGDAQTAALMQAMQARIAQMAGGKGAMAMSPEQLKQMQAQMAAMQGNGNAQSPAAMQAQMDQAMAGGDSMPRGAMAMPPGEMGMPLGSMGMAGGRVAKALDLSSDLPGDLKKGKTIIRNIDWIPGGGTVSPAGADDFAHAMARVAAAIKQAGGSYRLDLYMDKQSGNIVVRTLGPQRLAAVQASLVEDGATPGTDGPQIGKSMRDGDPRLEIVRLK